STWVAEELGYKEEITSKQMEKGTLVEDQSIDLLCENDQDIYVKNEVHFNNGWIKGTPDIITHNRIIDIKSPYTLRTFLDAKIKSTNAGYDMQLHGYCWLADKSLAELVYCLINTPNHIVYSEIRKTTYGMSEVEAENITDQIIRLHYFDNLPKSLRLHKRFVPINPDRFELIKLKVEQMREAVSKIILEL
ncbi:MAG: hypothetical protein ACRCZM_11450, partial [Bacteroidales bacterium]